VANNPSWEPGVSQHLDRQFGGLVDDDIELVAVKTPQRRLSPVAHLGVRKRDLDVAIAK
jgi:hypothetical protein